MKKAKIGFEGCVDRLIAVVVLVCLVTCCPTQATDAGTNAATGKQGMAATAHPLASQAAIEILKAGGNAVDAAVAAAFTIGVVEPDGSGLGGGGGMVIYLVGTREARYINYYHRAVAAIDELDYDSEHDRHTGKAVLVPGTVAGLCLASERFGRLPLAEVMEPAIRHASEGFPIDATLAQILLDNVEMLQRDSATASVFLDEGFPLMEGDMLSQPDLARTLRLIAEGGPRPFYTGPVAQAIVDKVQADGGTMTLDDMAAYDAEITVPVEGTYRGHRVLSANVPQSGVTIIQALNMLENVQLSELGPYWESGETLHLMAETMRRAYADRWLHMGDPDVSHVPVHGFISKQYARERFNDINRYRAEPRQYRLTEAGQPGRYDDPNLNNEVTTGQTSSASSLFDDEDVDNKTSYEDWAEDLFDAWGGKKGEREKTKSKTGDSSGVTIDVFDDSDSVFDDGDEYDGHTTHLSVIDAEGNMVSLTQTLGTFFGAGLTAEGVLLNCGMSNFSRSATVNVVSPRQQPRSSIAPTIVLKKEKPYMVVGSPGAGRIMCTVVELIVNVIDFNLTAEAANYAPRFYCQKFEDHLYLEGGISEEVRSALERKGHSLRVYEGRDLFFGGVQIILVDPVTGGYRGSADPRRGGAAIGF